MVSAQVMITVKLSPVSYCIPTNWQIFKGPAKALISLRICASLSDPLLVSHTKLLEISCYGSYYTMVLHFMTADLLILLILYFAWKMDSD